MGVLEARPDQPEVVEQMLKRLAGDSDRYIKVAHVGEVRQTHAARLVGLAEDDLLVLAMLRTPCPDASLHSPPDTGREIRMPAQHLLEDATARSPGAAWRSGTISASKISANGSGRRLPRGSAFCGGSLPSLGSR